MSKQDDKTKPITVYPLVFEFLDASLESAMLLSQLLYWTSRSSMRGWVAKSDKEFQKELCLKRYSVRKAINYLLHRGLIETDVRKFSGAPTQHYRVKLEELNKQWDKFIGLSENEQSIIRKRTIHYSNSDNPGSSENEQSLTETTQRLPPIETGGGFFKNWKTTSEKYHPFFQACINTPIALPEPQTEEEVKAWLKTFDEWILKNFTQKEITKAGTWAQDNTKIIASPKSLNWILNNQHSRAHGKEITSIENKPSVIAQLRNNQRKI
jgi:hypothetical protein